MKRYRLPVAAGLTVLGLNLGGCLERTISITTEPEGAIVWLNDVEVGRTPLETDFTFYGTYDVRIRKEGYEPLITHADADPPIQELPGIDFLAEAMPVNFSDLVKWHWVLTPVAERTEAPAKVESDLIARASVLRAAAAATGSAGGIGVVAGDAVQTAPGKQPGPAAVPPTPQPTPQSPPEPAPEPAKAPEPASPK